MEMFLKNLVSPEKQFFNIIFNCLYEPCEYDVVLMMFVSRRSYAKMSATSSAYVGGGTKTVG